MISILRWPAKAREKSWTLCPVRHGAFDKRPAYSESIVLPAWCLIANALATVSSVRLSQLWPGPGSTDRWWSVVGWFDSLSRAEIQDNSELSFISVGRPGPEPRPWGCDAHFTIPSSLGLTSPSTVMHWNTVPTLHHIRNDQHWTLASQSEREKLNTLSSQPRCFRQKTSILREYCLASLMSTCNHDWNVSSVHLSQLRPDPALPWPLMFSRLITWQSEQSRNSW